MQELGREPTPEEIGLEMDLTPARVREILKIAQDTTSLATPIGDEEDSLLGDFIEDTSQPQPYDQASKQLLKENIDPDVKVIDFRSRRKSLRTTGVEGPGIPTARSRGVLFEASTDGKRHETGPVFWRFKV